MAEAKNRVKHLITSGLRRRRIRIWAVAVVAVVAALSAQVFLPDWRFLPASWTSLGPGVILLVFLAAMVCEYVDSSLGMGYGTTLTPLLLLAGFDPIEVVPCVLLSEAASGIAAMLMHQRDGNADFVRDRQTRSTAILLSILSAIGAVAAVVLALQLPKVWLKAIISIVVVSVGLVVLATFRRRVTYRKNHLIALGVVAAFNKGLSGGGYGPLVTSGQIVSGMSPKQAVAITSVAEAWTCVVGLAAFLFLHQGLQFSLAIPLVTGALLSVPVATMTVQVMNEKILRCTVGILTCTLGIMTLLRVVL